MLTETQKKQQKQLAALFIIILITIGIFLFSRKSETPASSVSNFSQKAEIVSSNMQVQEIDSSILFSESFRDLKKNGQYPVESGTIGRNNPFIPYEGAGF